MTEPKKKTEAAKPEVKTPEKKYTEEQLQEAISKKLEEQRKKMEKMFEQTHKENIQAERTRLARVNEDKIADALERQEKVLKKENNDNLGKHTQVVRQNAYDTVLEKMRQAFLMKQQNLSFPALTVNEYNELVEEFGSQAMKDAPLL